MSQNPVVGRSYYCHDDTTERPCFWIVPTPTASKTFTARPGAPRSARQVGKADIVSPSLKPGRYTVRIFVDSDGDGYLDPGELSATYMKLQAAALIEVITNRTTPLSLTLAPTL